MYVKFSILVLTLLYTQKHITRPGWYASDINQREMGWSGWNEQMARNPWRKQVKDVLFFGSWIASYCWMMNCNIPTYHSVLLLSKLDIFGQEILLECTLPFFERFPGMPIQRQRARQAHVLKIQNGRQKRRQNKQHTRATSFPGSSLFREKVLSLTTSLTLSLLSPGRERTLGTICRLRYVNLLALKWPYMAS